MSGCASARTEPSEARQRLDETFAARRPLTRDFVGVIGGAIALLACGACGAPMAENARATAARDLSCAQGSVEIVQVTKKSAGNGASILTPDTRTYVARGCGREGRYECDFARSSCERIDAAAPPTRGPRGHDDGGSP